MNAGVVQASALNTLPAATALTVASGAVLTLQGGNDVTNQSFSETVASLAGVGQVSLGSAVLTTGDNTSTTFSGTLGGTGGLVKQGSGTFTLSGFNSYVGGTTVNGGTLLVTGSDFDSATTVNAGATLGGTGTVGAVTVWGGSVSPGTTGPGILTASGNVLFSGSSIFSVLPASLPESCRLIL